MSDLDVELENAGPARAASDGAFGGAAGDVFGIPGLRRWVKRHDKWGGAFIPEPGSGPGAPDHYYQRVTTLASVLDDKTNLTKWNARMAIKGVTARADLSRLAVTTPLDDKDALNKIVDRAVDFAKGMDGGDKADLGTALHNVAAADDYLRETAGHGLPARNIPAGMEADLAARRELIEQVGARFNPEWIERTVVNPAVNGAGTWDRLVLIGTPSPDNLPAVWDDKTGDVETFNQNKFGAQLATYATATAMCPPMWDIRRGAEQYQPIPEIDQETAWIMQCPVGQGIARLYRVQVQKGWRRAQLCYEVVVGRKDTGEMIDLAFQASVATAGPEPRAGAVTIPSPRASVENTEESEPAPVDTRTYEEKMDAASKRQRCMNCGEPGHVNCGTPLTREQRVENLLKEAAKANKGTGRRRKVDILNAKSRAEDVADGCTCDVDLWLGEVRQVDAECVKHGRRESNVEIVTSDEPRPVVVGRVIEVVETDHGIEPVTAGPEIGVPRAEQDTIAREVLGGLAAGRLRAEIAERIMTAPDRSTVELIFSDHEDDFTPELLTLAKKRSRYLRAEVAIGTVDSIEQLEQLATSTFKDVWNDALTALGKARARYLKAERLVCNATSKAMLNEVATKYTDVWDEQLTALGKGRLTDLRRAAELGDDIPF